MRDLKFRAKSKAYDGWQYWNVFENPPIKLIEKTIGQFTGILDKNGKEIYEGDIVATSDNGDLDKDKWSREDWGYEQVTITAEDGVSFGDWSWQDEQSVFALKYVEVIGNQFENPELINP